MLLVKIPLGYDNLCEKNEKLCFNLLKLFRKNGSLFSKHSVYTNVQLKKNDSNYCRHADGLGQSMGWVGSENFNV